MAENDLEIWLQNARSAGLSREQIVAQLKTSGWTDEHIGQLFGAPAQDVGSPSQSAPPLGGAKKWFARHLGLVIGIGVGVLLLGGAAFAAYRGYIPIPFLAKTNLQEQLEKAIEVLSGSKSGEFGLVVNVKVEPHDGNAKRLPGPKEGEVSPAQARSQDSLLASNASQIRTALALYYDSNNAYPDALNALVTGTKYISTLPKEVEGHAIAYTVTSDKKEFTLEYTCVSDTTKKGKIESKNGTTVTCLSNDSNPSVLEVFDTTAFFQFLPTDMQIEGSIVTFVAQQEKDGKKTPRGYVAIKGSYASGGTTISVDGEARMQDGRYYGIVRQFPSLFFIDLTSIKDKWVVIDPAAGDTASDILPIDNLADVTPKNNELGTAKQETATFIRKALDTKAITLTREGTENINGRRLSKIKITMDADKLPAAVTAYKEDATQRNALVKDVGEMLDELVAPANLESLRVIAGQTSLMVWLENLNATPHKLELTTILVPPEKVEKLKDKQIRATIALTFEHLGDQPNVDVPSNPITWDEAQRLIMGITEEQQKFEKQRSAVDDLRAALQNYSKRKGAYPDTLAALLEKPEATNATGNVNAGLQIESIDSSYGNYDRPLENDAPNYFGNSGGRSAVPNDVFTGKAFEYTKRDAGYSLTYQMVLPKSTDEETFGSSDFYTSQYMEGKNTATHKTLSVEKQAEKDAELGITAEERTKVEQFDTQIKSISKLRTALSQYYRDQKKYPENLTALTEKMPTASYSYLSGAALPKDVYTGKEFTYTTTGETFAITYTIHLPSKTYSSYGNNLPSVSSTQLKEYVEGNNTATQSYVSEEAATIIRTPVTSTPTFQGGNSSATRPLTQTTGKPLVIKPYTSALAGSTGTLHFWVRSENWNAASYMQMANFLDTNGRERMLIRYANDGQAWLSYILYPQSSSVTGWTAKYTGWQPNTWTHIATSWVVGEVPKLYVNGTYLDTFITASQASLVMTQEAANSLGTAGTLYLNGRKMSDGGNTEVNAFTVESRVLSAQEIQALWAKGYTAST